jgi:D-tyrosyl-tRNA(Tyr) deacylase
LRLLLQRVTRARVVVDDRVTGDIGKGLLVLVGLGQGDTEALFAPALEKIVNLRIFNDDEGKMNRSLVDVAGGLLIVSQFTLYADARKGRRPSYTAAMPPAEAAVSFEKFFAFARDNFQGGVAGGEFGAHMAVELINDGPVTIWLDSAEMNWGAKTP